MSTAGQGSISFNSRIPAATAPQIINGISGISTNSGGGVTDVSLGQPIGTGPSAVSILQNTEIPINGVLFNFGTIGDNPGTIVNILTRTLDIVNDSVGFRVSCQGPATDTQYILYGNKFDITAEIGTVINWDRTNFLLKTDFPFQTGNSSGMAGRGQWELGVIRNVASVVDNTKHLEVTVDGVIYKLAVCI